MPSRWRFTNLANQGGNSVTGLATTGEVEDHMMARIGDFVWNDANGNGLQDNGEAGISGVTVKLLDADGNPVIDGNGNALTAVTGSNGKYLFNGLPVGTYQVEFVRPEGYLFTRPDADGLGLNGSLNSDVNPLTGRSASFQLNTGELNLNIDAGLFVPGSIAGAVYFDSKGDHHGDIPMPGVQLCLVDASGEPVCDPHNVALTTTTCEEGCYSFTNLPPGHYQVVQTQPDGYFSVSDVDGGDLDINGDMSIITLGSGQDVTGQDFVESMLTTISGHVFVKNVPLAGVTITLIDRFGNPVDGDPETPGIQPITTVTGSNGYYVFHNAPAGTYMVGQTRPQGYLSFGDADGGDPDLIGDITPIGTLPGEHSENNDFILMLDGCPDNWTEWKLQHPGETAQGNPDADDYDNLAEFAFAMPYDRGTGSDWLGSTAWVIQPSVEFEGTIEAVFIRPKGAPLDVSYTLQYAATLGNPTVWAEIIIDTGITGNATTEDNGDCTETVTIHGLESLTGLTGGEGFVRIKAVLDDKDDNSNDHTTFTEVEGWTVTDLEICCQTYNMPYQRETAFTGTISEVNGQVLTFADADALDTLLATGGSFYLEVTSGDNEGHRFDIVSTSGNTVTVAEDANIHAGTAPFNTLAGTAPASLEGDTVAVRRHWTLDEVFPPSAFGATNSQSSADQVQVFAGGAWTIYWLYDASGSPRWVSVADAGNANMGANVIPPGQGVFFNNRHTAPSLLAYGEVRANDFVRPLAAGNNLVGGGYPIAQSANGTGGRAMNIATGFFANRDFKKADSIHIWRADTQINAPGYDGYYLVDATAVVAGVLRWVKIGDPSLSDRDAQVILHGNRAAFIRSHAGLGQYTSPSPWTP
jgi:large repetitive protein